jgi:hypothetical protein
MENSSLIELLKVLTTKELKDFFNFLHSPYHNKGRYRNEVQILFDSLYKYAPNYDNSKLTKEFLSKNIFSDNIISDGRLEKVMVELSKSIKIFLLSEYYFRDENEPATQVDFTQILIERKLIRKATNLANSLTETLHQKKEVQTKDYLLSYRVSNLIYLLEAQKNTWRKDLNIKETLRHLDLYYFSSRTTLINHYLLLSIVAKVETGINIEKEQLLQELIGINIEESPTIFLSQKIFDLFSNTPNQDAFNLLLKTLNELRSNLNELEIKEYFNYLRTYCSVLLSSGHSDLWPVLHKIQKENLVNGSFYSEDMLTSGSFILIINASLKSNDIDWCLNFIETHKNRIVGDNETQDYYRLGKANYLFHLKKYEDALDFIPPSSSNLDLHLVARRLELKVYYETDSDLLTYKIDAFKMYLSRASKKLLSEDGYEMNSNFVNILYQLMQSQPGDLRRGAVILQRIEEKKQLIAKDWLVEKAKELK